MPAASRKYHRDDRTPWEGGAKQGCDEPKHGERESRRIPSAPPTAATKRFRARTRSRALRVDGQQAAGRAEIAQSGSADEREAALKSTHKGASACATSAEANLQRRRARRVHREQNARMTADDAEFRQSHAAVPT